MVNEIEVRHFKRVENATVPLEPITILVGANNSGKTTVLQAAHFGVSLLQTSVLHGPRFGGRELLYNPTDDVQDLAHGERLFESPVEIVYSDVEGEKKESLTVKLTASTDGAAIVDYDGSDALFAKLSDIDEVFSVYVPGLAGIPPNEEFRSDGVVRIGIARGDANLFLRNVLMRILKDENKKSELQELLDEIFPGARISYTFDPKHDTNIDVRVEENGSAFPIDLSGTGLLQFLQIAAYTVNFRPSLLLLDEPDAHLHPSNQRLIAAALLKIAEQSQTRVVIATHSRTILDAFADEDKANIFWLEGGEVQSETDKEKISMLLSLGALDLSERAFHGDVKVIVFTEDTKLKKGFLNAILEANGFDLNDVLIRSYKGSSEFKAASLLAEFVKDMRKGVEIIVHRDRDFMTDEEVKELTTKFASTGATLFVTNGSDIEASFADPLHLEACTDLSSKDADDLINGVITKNNTDIVMRFGKKRMEIKNQHYPGRQEDCPSSEKLIKGGPTAEHVIGKDLLGWVNHELETRRIAKSSQLVAPSQALEHPTLGEVASRVYSTADTRQMIDNVAPESAAAENGCV